MSNDKDLRNKKSKTAADKPDKTAGFEEKFMGAELESEIKQDEDEVVNYDKDVLYYLDLAQRTKADFENYKRRNESLAKTSFDNGVKHSIEKLLPVIDSITQSKAGIKDTATLQGFEIINNQFLKCLQDLGVEKIASVGEQFNPNLHNAVMVVNEQDKEDDVVVEELQQGFIMGDKVIRHSVVKINKL